MDKFWWLMHFSEALCIVGLHIRLSIMEAKSRPKTERSGPPLTPR